MARVPLTSEGVSSERLILNLEKVALSEDQFFQLCRDNSDLRLELTAQKELIIMPPAGLNSSWRNILLSTALANWSSADGTGIPFDSSAGFTLPNSAVRSPDVSWVRRERFEALPKKDRERFGHLCPDFVAELMSPSNTLSELKEKMAEYIANGTQLGWLIDPYETRVYVYRPGRPVEVLEKPASISGDPILPGFTFNFAEIW